MQVNFLLLWAIVEWLSLLSLEPYRERTRMALSMTWSCPKEASGSKPSRRNALIFIHTPTLVRRGAVVRFFCLFGWNSEQTTYTGKKMNHSDLKDNVMNEQGSGINSISIASSEDDTTRRIAQLEATNTALREALASKNAHIAMLEEKILKMSVELASSRAREDEQNLMLRLSQTSQVTMADDFDTGNTATIDDSVNSIRSVRGGAHSASFTSSQSRFSFMPNWGSSRTLQTTDETMEMDESALSSSQFASNSSGGGCLKGGLIGNMIQLTEKNGNYEDLRVNFPVNRGRRRHSTPMTDNESMAPPPPNTSTSSTSLDQQQQRRTSMVGQLFRLGKSDRSMGEGSAESSSLQQRRKPNRSKIVLEVQTSSQTGNGLISSTVAFPGEDDDTLLGFE